MSILRFAAGLALVAGCTTPTHDPAAPAPPIVVDRVALDLVDRLGADDPFEREEAQRRLEEMGERAREAITAAPTSTDAEAQFRATQIVRGLDIRAGSAGARAAWESAGTLFATDLDDGQVRVLQGGVKSFDWTSAGRLLVVRQAIDDSAAVELIDPGANVRSTLLPLSKPDAQVLASPDGHHAAVRGIVPWIGPCLALVDETAPGAPVAFDRMLTEQFLGWSWLDRDRLLVAHCERAAGETILSVYDTSSMTRRELMRSPLAFRACAARDGRLAIAFERENGECRIAFGPADDLRWMRASEPLQRVAALRWSPDGQGLQVMTVTQRDNLLTWHVDAGTGDVALIDRGTPEPLLVRIGDEAVGVYDQVSGRVYPPQSARAYAASLSLFAPLRDARVWKPAQGRARAPRHQ